MTWFSSQRYSNSTSSRPCVCVTLARAGLTLAQLALAWCYRRWCVASTIIGATTMAQLEENLRAWGAAAVPGGRAGGGGYDPPGALHQSAP